MTQGKGLYDAIAMARDYIGLSGTTYFDEGKSYPQPSSEEDAKEMARTKAGDGFDFADGLLTYVDIDFDVYRNRLRNVSVKKNCTLPQWLEQKATAAGVNYSRVLQDALINIVGTDG